jgi:hypothetical protein
MATNYPSSLDSFVNPTSTDTLDSATVPHAAQHDNINDAVLAVETALGANLGNVVLPARSISTTAPLTGGGDLSANRTLAVSAGSTSASGVLQLTDSTSSTSTTTAATPNSVKTAYDTGAAKFQFLPFRSAGTYQNFNATASVAPTINTTYYTPMYFPNSITLDRINISTRNTFAGTATVRLGIYNDNGGIPSTVLLDAGTLSATAASTIYAITISQTITAGWYWLAFNNQTAATTNNYDGFTNLIGVPNPLFPRILSGGNAQTGYSQSVTVTSGFATAASLSDSGTGFRIAVRVA